MDEISEGVGEDGEGAAVCVVLDSTARDADVRGGDASVFVFFC